MRNLCVKIKHINTGVYCLMTGKCCAKWVWCCFLLVWTSWSAFIQTKTATTSPGDRISSRIWPGTVWNATAHCLTKLERISWRNHSITWDEDSSLDYILIRKYIEVNALHFTQVICRCKNWDSEQIRQLAQISNYKMAEMGFEPVAVVTHCTLNHLDVCSLSVMKCYPEPTHNLGIKSCW